MAVCSETYMAVCDEVQALRQKLEQAEARVAELEAWAGRRPNVHDRDLRTEFARWADEIGASNGAWLLRKQSETLEVTASQIPTDIDVKTAIRSIRWAAMELRQQADEAEK